MSRTKSFTIPADGPDAVLVRLVRQERLPFSRAFVSGRVARHPQPSSLLALVEVGAELGLKVTAGRTDGSGLDELRVPAVVHFTGPGSAGGFGVLEDTGPDGFQVWDSRNGRRRVGRDEVLEHWSGIVALVERDESRQASEPRHLRNRLMDLLVGSGAPPALAGGRAAPALRASLLLVLGSLLVIAGAGHPAETRGAALAMMALTGIGLVVSAALTVATADPRAALPGCPRGKLVDCESVLTSPYARIAGVPLSEVGAAFFGSILLLMATAAVSPDRPEPWLVAGIAYLGAAPFAVLLVAVQAFMRRFCTLCLLAHAAIASGAALSLVFLRTEWLPGDALPFGILLAGYLGTTLFVVVPFFARNRGIKALVESQRRAASSPFATLAQILTESPTPIRGATCGVGLAGAGAPHELVLFVHPSCAVCARTIQEGRELALAGQVELFLAIAPRDHRGSDRRACEALVAAGLGLGPEVLIRAYALAKEHFSALVTGEPIRFLSDNLPTSPTHIEACLESAESLVRRAEELAGGYVEGTPAIFINSRLYPYAAPLGHLAFLLERHPELLEPIRAAASRPAREAAST